MTWGAEQKTAKDKIKVKARNTTRQSLKIVPEIFSEGKNNMSITMEAYFYSPATPPFSSSFFHLVSFKFSSGTGELHKVSMFSLDAVVTG